MRPASKFKHVFGQPSRKDGCYENLRVTNSAHDGSFCAVNPRFIAVASETSGGAAFFVLPLKKVGRIEATVPRVYGHSGTINELKWSPFDDFVIASCSDDATIKVWRIPDYGLATSITQCAADLHGHTRRVTYIEWHPTAEHVLLSAGFDFKCIVWNVRTAKAVSVIQCHDNAIHSLSWNRDGSLFATSCKDKKIRIVDPRRRCIVTEGLGHAGLKPSKVAFVAANFLLTTGFSKRGDREIALWDSKDLSQPVSIDVIDYSSGVLLPFYDPDTQVVYVAGKGDGNIRYYEVQEDHPHLRFLSQYPSADPQRALCWMPKRGLDTSKCEVARFYKLHAEKLLIEPLPMIVPRRSSEFQEDIYPPTAAFKPSLTAEEWLSGIDRTPVLVPLQDVYARLQPKGTGSPSRHGGGSPSKDSKAAFAHMPAAPMPSVQLPATAPASLRNILKLSTDPSHVVAAVAAKPAAGPSCVASPSGKDAPAATEDGLASPAAAGAVESRVAAAVASEGAGTQPAASSQSLRSPVGPSDGHLHPPELPAPVVAQRDASSLDVSQTERAVPQQQQQQQAECVTVLSATRSDSCKSSSSSNEAHRAACGRADSNSAAAASVTSDSDPQHVSRLATASSNQQLVSASASTEQQLHPASSPIEDAADVSPVAAASAESLQQQQLQQLRARPKTWRDNSAWQQPALPVQPPEDSQSAALPRRLHSGRLVQPQVVGPSGGSDLTEKNCRTPSAAAQNKLTSPPPPHEVNGSSLSNDELHKTYFKQVEEIKSLRHQVSAKEKRIVELEAELDVVRKHAAELECAAATVGLTRCGHS